MGPSHKLVQICRRIVDSNDPEEMGDITKFNKWTETQELPNPTLPLLYFIRYCSFLENIFPGYTFKIFFWHILFLDMITAHYFCGKGVTRSRAEQTLWGSHRTLNFHVVIIIIHNLVNSGMRLIFGASSGFWGLSYENGDSLSRCPSARCPAPTHILHQGLARHTFLLQYIIHIIMAT